MPTEFEDIPVEEICQDREHNPPAHIVIPPGKRMRHRCPSCGKETVMTPTQVRFSVVEGPLMCARCGVAEASVAQRCEPCYKIDFHGAALPGETLQCTGGPRKEGSTLGGRRPCCALPSDHPGPCPK